MNREDDDICLQTMTELLEQKENELLKLKKSIEEKNEDLYKAGDLGRGLVEQNTHLEEMLESIQKEHCKVIEEYEQEKYSLQNRLEGLKKSNKELEQNLQEETQQRETDLEQGNKHLNNKIAELRSRVEDLNGELQQERLVNSQHADTLELKEKQIRNLQKELGSVRPSLSDTMSTEVAELTNENYELKLSLQESETEQHELTHIVQQLKDLIEIAKNKEENMKIAKEDAEREASNFYTALENSREERRELQVELDLLSQKPNDPNSKGNSLFAEVEDKRIHAEKMLISMKTQYKSMHAQNEQLKHYILKLKMQMSALLETRSRTSDKEHVRSLEESLSVARSDNMKLLQRMKDLQEKVTKQRLNDHSPSSGPRSDDSAVLQFFKNDIKGLNADVERLTEELRLNEIYLMVESKKVSNLQRDLYEKNKQLDSARSSSFRQLVEIDRLKMKCGEEVKVRSQQHRWKKEKINPTPAEIEASDTNEKENSTPLQHENQNTTQGRPLTNVDDPKSQTTKEIAESNNNISSREALAVKDSSEIQQNNPAAEPEKSMQGTIEDPKSQCLPRPTQEPKSAFVRHPCNTIETVDQSRVTTAADCKQQ